MKNQLIVKDFIEQHCKIEGTDILSLQGAWIDSTRIFSSSKFIAFLSEHKIHEIYGFNHFRKTMKSRVACCGFSEAEQRWYGWTHRGIRSFGIGDSYFSSKPAKTLDDCKKLAFQAVQALD